MVNFFLSLSLSFFVMIKQIISRVQRNHGLEHASIHVLSEKCQNFSAQGNSNARGFYLNIYGDVSEDDVAAAVEEAFLRMKNGEHNLAVHPNCGTVLLTTATMVTVAAQAAFAAEQLRQRASKQNVSVFFNGLPSAVLAAVVALILAKPAGLYLQEKYTTDGNLGSMQLIRIKQIEPSIVSRIFRLLLTTNNKLEMRSYFVETAG